MKPLIYIGREKKALCKPRYHVPAPNAHPHKNASKPERKHLPKCPQNDTRKLLKRAMEGQMGGQMGGHFEVKKHHFRGVIMPNFITINPFFCVFDPPYDHALTVAELRRATNSKDLTFWSQKFWGKRLFSEKQGVLFGLVSFRFSNELNHVINFRYIS